jgi:septal ring factor EnvC (AmiA/AmiB activator)
VRQIFLTLVSILFFLSSVPLLSAELNGADLSPEAASEIAQQMTSNQLDRRLDDLEQSLSNTERNLRRLDRKVNDLERDIDTIKRKL